MKLSVGILSILYAGATSRFWMIRFVLSANYLGRDHVWFLAASVCSSAIPASHTYNKTKHPDWDTEFKSRSEKNSSKFGQPGVQCAFRGSLLPISLALLYRHLISRTISIPLPIASWTLLTRSPFRSMRLIIMRMRGYHPSPWIVDLRSSYENLIHYQSEDSCAHSLLNHVDCWA